MNKPNTNNQMPILVISVVTYNSQRWLHSFMASLRAQAYPCASIRLLFRDNGSTDETPQQLAQIVKEQADKFAAISLVRGENVGFGRGHNDNFFNQGLTNSSCEWFLVSNVDLEFEHETLTQLVATANQDGEDVASWECRQKPYEHPKHYHPATLETAWSSSACILFRARAFRQIGGYEPRIFMYCEDVEISYRLRDHGWRLRYVPKATVWHFTYEDRGVTKPAQFLGSTMGNLLLRARYGSWREFLQGLLLYPALLLLPQSFVGQRLGVLMNAFKIVRLLPFFLLSRKKSPKSFEFRLWDYEFTRVGGFFALKSMPPPGQAPLVSILIRTVAGRSGKLLEAIASVRNQTYANIELVVVEDGSATAQSILDECRACGELKSVRFKALAKVGRCAAGNEALALASGELMCFLDDDDLLYADHVEVLVQVLLENNHVAAVYGLGYEVQTEVLSEQPWRYRELRHDLNYRQPFSRALMWHHNYLPIQTVLFKRELYEEKGGFDTELDNLEDWNLWLRYSLNRDFLMVDRVTSLYRVPAKGAQAVERQKQLDDYYTKAVAKHQALVVDMNPKLFLEMANELAQYTHLFSVQRATLRAWVLSQPGLARCYGLMRRIASRLIRRVG